MIILFLYTEIATYFTACCDELQKSAKVHVVRYPVNKEAPFTFENSTNSVKYYERKELDLEGLKKLVSTIKPDAIFCSGWIDKDYLKICSLYKNKIPTVLCMDTKWKGTIKQRIATFVSPFVLKSNFSHAWVPGEQQKNYAKKLGFKDHEISLGYYCADTTFFSNLFALYKEKKSSNFPKRFLYVGRYYDFKGITDIWTAFIALQSELPNDWELWCLGTGDIEPINHPKIKHFGFVQPTDLGKYIAETGVFILPSRFEPWAVVVHEYAAAGFPMILSSEVGAADVFLKENENGFLFKAANITDLKEKLKSIITLSDESLNLMSKKSVELAGALTTEKWAHTALTIINNAN
ncbi:MAG: glycosyltransferase [Bacteroidota bacterium]|nr:glycosyltransferase [Bacteroidota bacterium]